MASLADCWAASLELARGYQPTTFLVLAQPRTQGATWTHFTK